MAKGAAKSDWTVAYDPRFNVHMPYVAFDYGRHRQLDFWPADRTFTGELRFVDYQRGRSSATVRLEDRYHFIYSMFLAEFMRLVPFITTGGRIRGEWGFEKNGSNTGIYRIEK